MTKLNQIHFTVNNKTMAKKKENEIEKVLEEKFLTPLKFSYIIEDIVIRDKVNYIEAICSYCEREGIDVTSVSKLVTKPLKEKLDVDYDRLHWLKKSKTRSKARLPI